MTRKLIILFLISIGFLTDVCGQEMEVTSFRRLENDMTARLRETARLDNNGKTAALLKIRAVGRGYVFDGGTLGIVGNIEYHGNEIWVYVPERAQKISISHERYGSVRDYYYSEPIKAGSVYEMLLDPRVGRFVNITCNLGLPVYVDGDSLGVSPIVNAYLLYGKHHIKAEYGRIRGEQDINITGDSDPNIRIEAEDISKYFVNVTVRVADNAEIYYNGERKGVGSWQNEFYMGQYVIETRKANCEPRRTTIDVRPGQTAPIDLTPPFPHQGTIKLHVAPRDASIKANGKELSNGIETQINAGQYAVEFNRKGYVTQEKVYWVHRDQQTTDTIRMQRISYVKSKQFYFGAGFTYTELPGITGLAGLTYKNIDLQLSYTMGISSTDNLMWYYDGEYTGTANYKQNIMQAKLGYQIEAISRCAIVPQVGYALHTLSAKQIEGIGLAGDGAKCSSLTLGAKLMFVPSEHIGLFVNPEYALAMKKDKGYEVVAEGLGLTEGGLHITAGLIVKF